MIAKIVFFFILFVFIRNVLKLIKIQTSIHKQAPKAKTPKSSTVFDAEYKVIKEEL